MSETTLGQKLATYRKLSGMTQQKLGEYLNISAQAVSKWENDQSEPDFVILKKLASLYHTSLDKLLDANDASPISPDDVDAEAVQKTVNAATDGQQTDAGDQEDAEMETETNITPDENASEEMEAALNEPETENAEVSDTVKPEETTADSEEVADDETTAPEISTDEAPDEGSEPTEADAAEEAVPAGEEQAETPELVISVSATDHDGDLKPEETEEPKETLTPETENEPAPQQAVPSVPTESAVPEKEPETVKEPEKEPTPSPEELKATDEAIASQKKKLHKEIQTLHGRRAIGFTVGILTSALFFAAFLFFLWKNPIDGSKILTVILDFPATYVFFTIVSSVFYRKENGLARAVACLIFAPSGFPRFVSSHWEVDNLPFLTVLKAITIIIILVIGFVACVIGISVGAVIMPFAFPVILKKHNSKIKTLRAELKAL